METIPEKKKTIKTLRQERQWSQGRLGFQAGLSLKAISHLELGHPVHRSTFLLACLALEVKPEDVDSSGIKFSSRFPTSPGSEG